MKSTECINNRLAKKIRKILLINVDSEIRKKKRNKNLVLINSMTPAQLENKFLQIKEEPINTPTSYFTNLSEKFLIERVVDNKRKINYFYSDNLGKNLGMLILNRNPKNFCAKFSAENLKMNLGMFFHGEEVDKTQTQSTKDSNNDYVPLYSLNLHKKNICEYKSSKYLNNFQDIYKDHEEIDFENASANQKIEFFGEKTEKNRKSNYKFLLINFCYTRLKKKLSKNVSLDPNSKRPTMKEEKQEKITIGEKENIKEEIATDKIEKKKIKKKKNLFSLFHKFPSDKDTKNTKDIKEKKETKESKETKETKESEDINILMKYKSNKNNAFVNKLKDLYDNNNINNKNHNKNKNKNTCNDNNIFRKSKRTESQIKVNKNFLKLNTENDFGRVKEGLRISNKKDKLFRTKTNKKIITRKSTSDVKSNYKFFSPDKFNKFKLSNKYKFKKSHKFLLDIGEEDYINENNNIKIIIC